MAVAGEDQVGGGHRREHGGEGEPGVLCAGCAAALVAGEDLRALEDDPEGVQGADERVCPSVEAGFEDLVVDDDGEYGDAERHCS
uniref:hypothetical protein n=1 Tax=Streptomyces sp. CA-141956 TaxID=3240051 RepID=UPI003F496B8A